MDIEEQKQLLFEEFEQHLIGNDPIIELMGEIIEEAEEITAEELILLLEWKFDTDYTDKLKWELIKEYTSIENLHKANFEEIKQKFYNDIKETIEKVGEQWNNL